MISLEKKNQTRENDAVLDWDFDEDAQNNYRFTLDKGSHCFKEGDRIRLCVCGRSHCQLGSVLSVDEDGITVHTEEWLDISESYSLERVTG